MNEQGLLNALHGIQLWGIVGPSRDPSLGKGRCGSNDEFLEAYRELEDEVRSIISENERLRRLVIGLNWCTESAFGPGSECENCPLGDNKSLKPTCEDMMRELGIEV